MNEYEIRPSVDPDGSPTYSLIRVWAMPFACGEKLIATNPDRAFLERAIEHLKSK